MYGARNQVDVFSDRVNELAATIMKEADTSLKKALTFDPVTKQTIPIDPGIKTLIDDLTLQNIGTKKGKKN